MTIRQRLLLALVIASVVPSLCWFLASLNEADLQSQELDRQQLAINERVVNDVSSTIVFLRQAMQNINRVAWAALVAPRDEARRRTLDQELAAYTELTPYVVNLHVDNLKRQIVSWYPKSENERTIHLLDDHSKFRHSALLYALGISPVLSRSEGDGKEVFFIAGPVSASSGARQGNVGITTMRLDGKTLENNLLDRVDGTRLKVAVYNEDCHRLFPMSDKDTNAVKVLHPETCQLLNLAASKKIVVHNALGLLRSGDDVALSASQVSSALAPWTVVLYRDNTVYSLPYQTNLLYLIATLAVSFMVCLGLTFFNACQLEQSVRGEDDA